VGVPPHTDELGVKVPQWIAPQRSAAQGMAKQSALLGIFIYKRKIMNYELIDSLDLKPGQTISLSLVEEMIGYPRESDYDKFNFDYMKLQEYLSDILTQQFETKIVVAGYRRGMRILTETESVYYAKRKEEAIRRQTLRNSEILNNRDTSQMDDRTKEILDLARRRSAMVIHAMEKSQKKYPCPADTDISVVMPPVFTDRYKKSFG
jgi:hypothetical protein